jgi:hypothetical protein
MKVSVQAAHVLAVLNSYYPPEALIDPTKNNPSRRKANRKINRFSVSS